MGAPNLAQRVQPAIALGDQPGQSPHQLRIVAELLFELRHRFGRQGFVEIGEQIVIGWVAWGGRAYASCSSGNTSTDKFCCRTTRMFAAWPETRTSGWLPSVPKSADRQPLPCCPSLALRTTTRHTSACRHWPPSTHDGRKSTALGRRQYRCFQATPLVATGDAAGRPLVQCRAGPSCSSRSVRSDQWQRRPPGHDAQMISGRGLSSR